MTSLGCRIAPQHSGKLTQRSLKAAAKLVGESFRSPSEEEGRGEEVEDVTRGEKSARRYRVINFSCRRTWQGSSRKSAPAGPGEAIYLTKAIFDTLSPPVISAYVLPSSPPTLSFVLSPDSIQKKWIIKGNFKRKSELRTYNTN